MWKKIDSTRSAYKKDRKKENEMVGKWNIVIAHMIFLLLLFLNMQAWQFYFRVCFSGYVSAYFDFCNSCKNKFNVQWRIIMFLNLNKQLTNLEELLKIVNYKKIYFYINFRKA